MKREMDKRFVASLAVLGLALITQGIVLAQPKIVDSDNQDWRTLAMYTRYGQVGYTENRSGRNRDTVVFFNFLGRKLTILNPMNELKNLLSKS